MAIDPLLQLARQRTIEASQQLLQQLDAKAGSAPVIEIWTRLRENAATAMVALAVVDLFDPANIPKAVALQNEIKRYDEFAVEMAKMCSEGRAYAAELEEQHREQMFDQLTNAGEDGRNEAIELGLMDDIPGDR